MPDDFTKVLRRRRPRSWPVPRQVTLHCDSLQEHWQPGVGTPQPLRHLHLLVLFARTSTSNRRHDTPAFATSFFATSEPLSNRGRKGRYTHQSETYGRHRSKSCFP
ncbi:hypothetical protein IscW_ISCW014042 [Ixodes scapularis]|uniref:Uncharacterized protein n=1 Tax=Ixodes scapularis TaxID=6945 RepID=B7QMJ3_IXOSC|nr:hypothetical protein IscW_ISCW014042 [Ixodes scapularis]|eukprot:XP_002416398.1 hypothetical protein IscW_ISCW014042 [Ixodes scapularis]